jgi:hypothetical protein
LERENRQVDGLDVELRNAICRADPIAATQLIEAGADIHYRNESGYTAAIDAAYAGVQRCEQLIVLLELALRYGVDLDASSAYNESALSVLSIGGRFDGVRLLLNAGADPRPLGWTSLIEAVAIGTIDDVRREALPELLEAVDRCGRTAWLVALLRAIERERSCCLTAAPTRVLASKVADRHSSTRSTSDGPISSDGCSISANRPTP